MALKMPLTKRLDLLLGDVCVDIDEVKPAYVVIPSHSLITVSGQIVEAALIL